MTAVNGTVIYRELIDPAPILIKWLDDRNQLFNVLDNKGVEHLYVDNDHPRDADITPMIIQATKGFSLFTEQGKRITDYSRLDKAIRGQEGAQLVVVPEVELDEDIVLNEPVVFQDSTDAVNNALASRVAELEAMLAASAPPGNVTFDGDYEGEPDEDEG